VFTWLVADACIGLASSALFESRYCGLPTFTVVRPSDGVFRDAILEPLWHPGRGNVATALDAFLESVFSSDRPQVAGRARTRSRRLWTLHTTRPLALTE
jgi:hypothetical protein